MRDSSSIPDEKTIWVFRERINKAGGADELFEAVNQQIQAHGFIARGGQIVDATLVSAPRQHFSKDDKEIIEQGAIPADWTPAQRQQKDTEASWTKKHGKSYLC